MNTTVANLTGNAPLDKIGLALQQSLDRLPG
jgi:hypothetical protein